MPSLDRQRTQAEGLDGPRPGAIGGAACPGKMPHETRIARRSPEARPSHRADPGIRLLSTVGLREPPKLGRELFERVWVKDDPRSHGGDGLGPVFNGSSCVACHHLGGVRRRRRGRPEYRDRDSDPDRQPLRGHRLLLRVQHGLRLGSDGLPDGEWLRALGAFRGPRSTRELLAAIHPGFRESRSVVLHLYGTDPDYNAWRSSVSGRHGTILIRTSERNPPALFGAGLIDAIPDEAIEAAAKRKFPGSSEVRGRVSRLKDGRIGRFGWKAQTATLKEFVLSAAAGEMGLEVPGKHQAADPRLPGIVATGVGHGCGGMRRADRVRAQAFPRLSPASLPTNRKPSSSGQARGPSGRSAARTVICPSWAA